jgi:hypothetical protein
VKHEEFSAEFEQSAGGFVAIRLGYGALTATTPMFAMLSPFFSVGTALT